MDRAMRFADQVTPLILTFDEAPNIRRTLDALSWARELVVVDSGSTDGTTEILAAQRNVRRFQRRFDSFAGQCEFGLRETGIASDWVLYLDADHVVTEALAAEISALDPPSEVSGYEASFTYCVQGRPLRGSLYPPRTVLFRRKAGRFVDVGHGHRVEVAGKVEKLSGRIFHDDRKPRARWLAAQAGYAEVEARQIAAAGWRGLNWPDRIRKLVLPAPPLVPFWCLVAKGGWLDGRAGWHYALERAVAEAILSLRLLELHLERHGRDGRRGRD